MLNNLPLNHHTFKMKKIFYLLILGIFIFSFAFVSAENIGTFKLNEEMQITNYCSSGDCSSMNLSSITSPNGTLNYLNMEMTKNGQEFNYSFTPSFSGEYNFKTCANPLGDFTCDSDYFFVTSNGEIKDNMQLISRIFLILFCLLVIVAIQWNRKTINYDKWYSNLAKKYEKKNWTKFALGAVALNLMKNSWIFSYLVGLLGLLILTELTYFFNITSALEIMKIVLGLYSWSAIGVSLIFFSQVQEWIVGWLDDLQNLNWGIDKS